MSQFPSPYSQPPYSQPPMDFMQYAPVPQPDLLVPARRAAILQGILAGLVILCAVCLGATPWFAAFNADELMSQSGMQVPELPPGMTLDQLLRITYTVLGGCGSIVGITLLVLSFYVRRGTTGPIVTSIVLEALLLMFLAVNLISALLQLAANPVAGIAALAVVILPTALFGLNVTWLIAATRNAKRLRDVRLQYQAQFQQYQQVQQAYGQPAGYGMPFPSQGGYGYPTAPPTPPPSPTSPAPEVAPPAPTDDRPPEAR